MYSSEKKGTVSNAIAESNYLSFLIQHLDILIFGKGGC